MKDKKKKDKKKKNKPSDIEWHTPLDILEKARRVMKEIDLDPASSDFGNSRVNASNYFTKEDSGLLHDWYGNIFINPPYARGTMDKFVDHLYRQLKCGNIKQCVLICNNASDTQWCHKLFSCYSIMCMTEGRMHFTDKYGNKQKNTKQGQFIMYFGSYRMRFYREFMDVGHMVIPCKMKER